MNNNNIVNMTFFSRLKTAVTTITTALYNTGVQVYKDLIGNPSVSPVVENAINEEEPPPLIEEIDFSNVSVENITFTNGAVIKKYTYEMNEELTDDFDEFLYPLKDMLDEYHPTEEMKAHFKIGYKYSKKARTNIESTKYVTSNSVIISDAKRLIRDLFNKYEDVIIESIFLEVLVIASTKIAMMGSKYAESLVTLPETGYVLRYDDEYIFYNPSSISNCMFHSVVACMDPRKIGRGKFSYKDDGTKKKLSKDPLVSAAIDLKRKSGCTNTVSNGEDIKRVADYLSITIDLYNNKMIFMETFNGGDNASIKLLLHMNHCYAVVKFSDEIECRPRPVSDVIKATKKEENRDLCFYAADLEAFVNENNLSVAYAIGYAFYDKNRLVYKEFVGHLNCLDRFFKALTDTSNNKTIYFHNGGKYDINVIIQQFLLSGTAESSKYVIDNKSKVYLNGRYAKFVVLKGKIKLTFLDSICLFSMGLEACTGAKGFNVEHKKLTGNIDHRKVTIENYEEIMAIGMEVNGAWGSTGSEYLKNDVVGLLECLDKFGSDIWEDCGVNITKVISASSISKRIFKQNYIRSEWPISLLNTDDDSFIRESYHGGRTEAFFKGIVSSTKIDAKDVPFLEGASYYYDFTSLYPSVAAVGDCSLPYGHCHKLNLKAIFKKDQVIGGTACLDFLREKAVFLKVLVKSLNTKRKPLHCVQIAETGKLVFPHFNDWTECSLTGAEILLGIERGLYEYKPVEGRWFNKAPILKEYFKSLFEKKQEASNAGLESKALCYKIIANSGYGFWALKTEARPDVDILDAEDYDGFLFRMMNDFDDVYECGSKIIVSYKKNIEGAEKNIAIGSYITSLARIKIWSLMDDIDSLGGFTYYCDTDSVITNLKVENHPSLMETYMWDGCGVELGSLKNEIKDSVKKDCKKLGIPLQPKDCMDLVFFAGLKSYRYFSVYEYEGVKHIINDSKLKGYKQKGDFVEESDNVRKLENADYISLLQGGILNQTVSQFSSNKKGNKQEWQKIAKIVKNFRFTYNKGVVDEVSGIIRPFHLPRDVDAMMDEIDGVGMPC